MFTTKNLLAYLAVVVLSTATGYVFGASDNTPSVTAQLNQTHHHQDPKYDLVAYNTETTDYSIEDFDLTLEDCLRYVELRNDQPHLQQFDWDCEVSPNN